MQCNKAPRSGSREPLRMKPPSEGCRVCYCVGLLDAITVTGVSR